MHEPFAYRMSLARFVVYNSNRYTPNVPSHRLASLLTGIILPEGPGGHDVEAGIVPRFALAERGLGR